MGRPFHDSTTSPARTPASWAGPADSPEAPATVWETAARVVEARGAPMPIIVMADRTTQISRFIRGPDTMTTIFFGADRL